MKQKSDAVSFDQFDVQLSMERAGSTPNWRLYVTHPLSLDAVPGFIQYYHGTRPAFQGFLWRVRKAIRGEDIE